MTKGVMSAPVWRSVWRLGQDDSVGVAEAAAAEVVHDEGGWPAVD